MSSSCSFQIHLSCRLEGLASIGRQAEQLAPGPGTIWVTWAPNHPTPWISNMISTGNIQKHQKKTSPKNVQNICVKRNMRNEKSVHRFGLKTVTSSNIHQPSVTISDPRCKLPGQPSQAVHWLHRSSKSPLEVTKMGGIEVKIPSGFQLRRVSRPWAWANGNDPHSGDFAILDFWETTICV